jgi:lysophospholipase L1-like esterase
MGAQRRSRRLLVRLSLICLGIALPLVVIEAGMRLYSTYVKVRSPYKAVAGKRIFERKPHSEREVNALGFRDREHPRQKPNGVYRIVVLGDSVTDGFRVDLGQRYTDRLEALLNRGRRRHEVVVVALNQYSTVQQIELFKDVGLELRPDLVILGYVLNDPSADGSINDFFRRERVTSLALDWLGTELRRTLFGLAAWERLPGCRSFDYYSDMHCDAAKWAAVQAALKELADLSRRHDFRVLVVVFPALETAADASFDAYPWDSVHAQVLNEASRHELMTLDLLPHFAVRRPAELKLAPGDALHPNALGHQLAAAAIYAKLVGLGIAADGS